MITGQGTAREVGVVDVVTEGEEDVVDEELIAVALGTGMTRTIQVTQQTICR